MNNDLSICEISDQKNSNNKVSAGKNKTNLEKTLQIGHRIVAERPSDHQASENKRFVAR